VAFKRIARKVLIKLKLIILARKVLIKFKLIIALIQLSGTKIDGLSESLSQVIKEIIIGKQSKEEKKQINEIERIRSILNKSKDDIEIIVGYNAPENKYDQLRTVSDTIGSVSKTSSMSDCWAFMLFKIIRGLKPKTCFEMGTCLGISAAYQGSALKLNQSGHLTTFELSQSKIDVAKTVFNELNLDNIETICGKFQDTLERELIKKQPIDYVFIDGHHDGEATINYFELLVPYLANNAIVVFDDINWSSGMKKAWNVLNKDRRLSIAVDLLRIGICIFDKPKKTHSIP